MKILSLNCRNWNRDTDKTSSLYWKNRMNTIASIINTEDPDILCFQELLFPATTYIPNTYRKVGIGISHSIYIKKGIKVNKSCFKIHYNYIVLNKETIIVNIHSHWKRNIITRNLDNILKDIKGYKQQIICGDFNNSRNVVNEIFENNNGQYLYHARTEQSLELPITFKNFDIPESYGEIDHFYFYPAHRTVNDKFGVIPFNYKIIETPIVSDHRPIVLDIDYNI